MPQAAIAFTTPRARRVSSRSLRATLEAALDQLLTSVETVVAQLDTLDGDPDLELTSEDEGAACEDEGFDSDKEPDHESEDCNWQDEGDQSALLNLPVYRKRPPGIRSPHQNVGGFIQVRAL